MLKLYYSPGACSLAPHIVSEELKIPVDLIKVDLKNKIYAGGDFFKINPKGSVPTLQLDNGEVLTEAVAIMQYLADQNPAMQLMPQKNSWEHYKALEWLNFIATEIHKGFSPLWKADNSDEVKAKAKDSLLKQIKYINSHLEKNNFILGNTYSIADAYLFTVVNWAFFLKIDLSLYPSLLKFIERVKERPATVAALKAEGLIK